MRLCLKLVFAAFACFLFLNFTSQPIVAQDDGEQYPPGNGDQYPQEYDLYYWIVGPRTNGFPELVYNYISVYYHDDVLAKQCKDSVTSYLKELYDSLPQEIEKKTKDYIDGEWGEKSAEKLVLYVQDSLQNGMVWMLQDIVVNKFYYHFKYDISFTLTYYYNLKDTFDSAIADYVHDQLTYVTARTVGLEVSYNNEGNDISSDGLSIDMGEEATITVTVRNTGNVAAFYTNAEDSPPETGLTFVSGSMSANGNLWGTASTPNVDVYVQETSTWVNSSETEWVQATPLFSDTWEYSFEDLKLQSEVRNVGLDYDQPLIQLQREDDSYLVTLVEYGGDFHSDIYVGDVLLWSGAGGGEDEKWGVGETRVAPPLDLKLYVHQGTTDQLVEYHEAQWCRFRLIEEGGWLYRFEDLKGQSLSLEPSGSYDFNQPILLVEKVGGNYEVTIEAYESAYHSDIWVEGNQLWTNAGGPERAHVGETTSVQIVNVNTSPEVEILVHRTDGTQIWVDSDEEWCKWTYIEPGGWLYLFEDLKGQPVKPDYDYNQPILLVQKVGDQYSVEIEEYESAYYGDIYAGNVSFWSYAGGPDGAFVDDTMMVSPSIVQSLTYTYTVRGSQPGEYTINTTATCKDRLGLPYSKSDSVTITVRQNDAGSKGDAGNTPAEALSIPPGDYGADITQDDNKDWYQTSEIQGSMLRVRMAPPSGADFDLYLYDQYLNLIANSENRGSASEEAIHVVRVSGYYYIEIRKYSGLGYYTFTVEVDDTPPTSSIDPISPYWHNTLPLTITAQASDDLSGVESVALWYRYSADNVAWNSWALFGTDSEAPWLWSFTAPEGDGFYEFYTIAIDWGAKVEEAPETADVKIGVDTTPPESWADPIDPYWQNSSSLPFEVTATASDPILSSGAVPSGLVDVMLFYRYSGDGSNWSDWQLFGVDEEEPWEWSFDAPEDDGHYQFGTLAIDRAGNCEPGVEEQRTLQGEVRGGVEGEMWIWVEPPWVDGEEWVEYEELLLLWMEIEGEDMGAIWENGGASPTDVGIEMMDVGEVQAKLEWGYGGWEIWGTISLEQPVRRRNVLVENLSGEIWGQYWVEEWGDTWSEENGLEEPSWAVGEFSGSVTAETRITWPEATASALVLHQIEFEETSEDTIPADRPIYYGFTINTPPISLALDWDDGDLDLHLYDPEGRHVGWNYETNGLELEIPGAEYSGRNAKPERIQVTNPQSGLWMVMIYPYEVEEETDYTLGLFRDVSPPESSVEPISPYWRTEDTFEVSATASDPALVGEEVPSGVESVELWYRYSVNNSSWTSWGLYGTDDSEPHAWAFDAPEGDGHYEFYTVATDSAGNIEEAPSEADAECGVDTTPPESSVDPIEPCWQGASMIPFEVTATASDELSGVEKVELWYRKLGPSAATWSEDFEGETIDSLRAQGWEIDGPASVEGGLLTKRPGTGRLYFKLPHAFSDYSLSFWYHSTQTRSGVILSGNGFTVLIAATRGFATFSTSSGSYTVYGVGSGNYELQRFGTGVVLLYEGQVIIDDTAGDAWDERISWEATDWEDDHYFDDFVVVGAYSPGDMEGSVWKLFGADHAAPFEWSFDAPEGDGHYEFYTLAVDAAGNTEQPPPEADTTAGVDTIPPVSSVDQIEPYWRESVPFTVSATATDALSGVARVELYYRSSIDGVNWSGWKLFGADDAAPYEWSFTAPDGYAIYEFYSIATDVAGNVEETPEVADAACGLAIPATIDIDPDTLNLRSQGRWVTAYIELPNCYEVANIDVSTIMLEGTVPAEAQPVEIGDYDGDGVPDLMVKFDRSQVQGLVSAGEVELAVTGTWHAVLFKGSDTIRVIETGEGQQNHGYEFEAVLNQSGEHPSQGQETPQTSPGQGGQPSDQANEQSSQGNGNSGGNQGQGQTETPHGQSDQSQGQGNQQPTPSETPADIGAGNQGNGQGQGPSSTPSEQGEQPPGQSDQGGQSQGNQGSNEGSGQGNGNLEQGSQGQDSGNRGQGNGQGNENGGGNQGQGNAKGQGK